MRLDVLYPIVYLDCIHVKTRDAGAVRTKAVYLAPGISMTGEKELLGLWIAQTEGAKFWPQVVTERKNRGAQDIFIACVDGLKGFPEANEAVHPKTAVQLCLAHMVRHSLNYVDWKLRKVIAAGLKIIYAASTADEAQIRPREFDDKLKLFCLALASISKKWTMPLRDWKAALTRFTIQFEERMPKN